MALADEVVVGIVAGRHFEGAGAELRVDVFVGDDGDLALKDGHEGGTADEMGVALVIGMDGDGGVAEDGFGAGGADFDVAGRGGIAVGCAQGVAEGVKFAIDWFVFDFEVADGAFAAGAPVDEVVAAVYEVVVIEADKGFEDGVAEAVVEGEAFAGPVAGDAHAALLATDLAVIFVFPGPDFLEEAFTAEVVAGGFALGEFAFDDVLGGDASVICAGNPEGGAAGHTIVADEHILDSAGGGVAEVERAGNVGRRHGDDEGRSVRVGETALDLLFGAEEALRLPPFVELFFPLSRLVDRGHFLTRFRLFCRCHCTLCSHR